MLCVSWFPFYQDRININTSKKQDISNWIKILFLTLSTCNSSWLNFVFMLLQIVFKRWIFPLLLCVALNRKLKKTSNELADKMDSLSLDDPSPNESKNSTQQMLSQVENIFSFPTADSSTFPKSHCQELIQLIQHLPQGKIFDAVLISGAKYKHFHVWVRRNVICTCQ